MDCSLWFGRCRINSASEIAEHFDMASLRGYYLGGSLAEWLREHGGEQQAALVEQLDPSDKDLDRRLAEIFEQAPAAKQEVFSGLADNRRGCADCGSFSGSGVGSWNFGSGMGFGSMALGSGSYFGGSFSRFSLWEWEWEWRFGGSFYRHSGSFGGTSWRGGSFMGGSFGGGSFIWGGSFMLGSSFLGFGAYPFGSFAAGYGSFLISADDYDRIMYECLRKCPLDCFGYGIHII